MKTTETHELLRAYAQDHSESAFQELVNRYVNLVYSAAIRRVDGDTQLAEDVTQEVFTHLAGKAGSLPPDVMLGGWLHRHTGFAASTAMRGEQRRRNRERQAVEMNALNEPSETDWKQLAPVLDEAMDELDAADRDALVLRYFERRELRAVGAALGVSDDTAQKRVSRALDKMREHLSRRGISSTAIALSIVLSANAVQAAPVGLAATLSTAALAGTTIAATATATAIKAIAMTTLQKTLIAATLVAAVGTGIYEARQVQTLLQQQGPFVEQIAQLTRDYNDATNRLAALRDDNERLHRNTAELLKLRGEVSQLRANATPKSSTPPASPLDTADAAAFERQKQMLFQAQDGFSVEGRLLQMKKHLHLTSEQEASVREILARDPRLRKLKEDVEALLTSEQHVAYDQLEQQTQRDHTRLMVWQSAIDMLELLQSNIGLNQEQQDKAFPALLEYAQQKVTYDGKNDKAPDAYRMAEEDLTRLTLNALKGVLTDEEMAIYKNFAEQMLKVKQFRLPSENH